MDKIKQFSDACGNEDYEVIDLLISEKVLNSMFYNIEFINACLVNNERLAKHLYSKGVVNVNFYDGIALKVAKDETLVEWLKSLK